MPLDGGAGASRRPAGGAYGSPRKAESDESDQDAPGGEPSSGKRRADVTAVDLGYTGRRSRASHATVDDSYEADEDTGYSGYGAPAPDEYGPDPMAERFENWRQSTDNW
jgi:hypothetical protein